MQISKELIDKNILVKLFSKGVEDILYPPKPNTLILIMKSGKWYRVEVSEFLEEDNFLT